VLFFDYEPTCGATPRDLRRVLSREELQAQGFVCLPKMYFCIEETQHSHEYKAVVNALLHGGLYRTAADSGKWCLYWSEWATVESLRSLNPFQKVNHFSASWHIGRKDLLWKNVHRLKRKWPQEFKLTPVSYVLPEDFKSWVRAREQEPGAFWIYKPVGEACGRGIRLFSSKVPAADDSKLQQKSHGIIQKYLDRPLLINGFKFDLRLYVVVTSFEPLRVYLNPEGLVRLATEPYSLSRDNLDHQTMHLTNFSVNKHSEAYVPNLDSQSQVTSDACPSQPLEGQESDGDCEGASQSKVHPSKWSFSQLREYLLSTGKDYDMMMERIKDLIIKTLIAVETPIVNACQVAANFANLGKAQQIGPNQTSFEIYGFDVIVDEKLKPLLLEVNTFPSFASSSPFDKRIKSQLASDALTLIGFLPFGHELVERSTKEHHMRRLQGIAPPPVGVMRSHTVQSLASVSSLLDLGEAEWQMILDVHDEYMRRGKLERIYPTEKALGEYTNFFETPRYANLVLDCWLKLGGEKCFVPDTQTQLPIWLPKQVCFESC
jgi:tubulin polyglutamylase TTLL4